MNTPSSVAASASASPASGGGAARARRQPVGLWRTVLCHEWRLLRTDAGLWLAVLLLLACMAHAVFTGQQRVAERSAAAAVALKDHGQRLQSLQRQLQDIEAGRAAPPIQPWRDPTNPLGVGRGSGAAIAHWTDSPLAATAVGLSDLYPASFRVGVGSRDRFLFADEIANPLQLATGSFDLAFVTVYLLPLLLVALGYNVLSGEREQGTWALTAASSAPPGPVLLAKLLLRNGIPVAVLLLCTPLALARLGAPLAQAGAATALLAWAATVLLYAGFWLLLMLWVNSWQRSSAFNAVALVLAWVLLLVVAPAAINATAQALYPAPARAEVVLAVRQAAVEAERDREAEQARFRADHGLVASAGVATAGSASSAERRTLALTLAADRRADEVLSRHEALVQQQRRLTERLGLLSPPLLVNDALAELAGNGPSRWGAYLQRVDSFHGRWQGHFVALAERGQRLSSADLTRWPRFEAGSVGVWAPGAWQRVLLAWGVLLLAAAVLGVRALRALRHAA